MTFEQFKLLIIILLIFFILFSILKKTIKFAIFVFCFLVIMQLGYVLSQTSLNNKIPLSNYFKYDVISVFKK